MREEVYDCYLIKQKDGKLLKFSYDREQGIYCQLFIKGMWSEKKSLYKESFAYFYVLEDAGGNIHVFCQDICGSFVLCTMEGTQWKYSTLLHMKYNVITPISMKAFFHCQDIHLLYPIIDKETYTEVLIHQRVKKETGWSFPQIIAQLEGSYESPYRIITYGKDHLALLHATLSDGYQLISRNFHMNQERWGKEEILHTSLFPYVDFSFHIEENKNYYLFITQEEDINRVIYQYKERAYQKNTVLYEHKKMDSCLLLPLDNALWALWICGGDLYGCCSGDDGQSFSEPRVYGSIHTSSLLKVFYQECSAEEQRTYIPHETYVMNLDEELFFLEDLLKSPINSKKENQGRGEAIIEIKGKKEDIEIREKEELQTMLKEVKEQLRNLNEVVEYEKNQVSTLQNQLYKAKEKMKLLTEENERLKERNRYLERQRIANTKEKISIEKKFAQQPDIRTAQKLPVSERDGTKITEVQTKQKKNSFAKWLMEEENKE